MSAKLNNYTVESKPNFYPDLINRVDTSSNNVKAFLPFIKKYSFLNAFQATSEMLHCVLDNCSEFTLKDDKNCFYEINRVNYLFINLDYCLNNPSLELGDSWIYSDIGEMFENIIGSHSKCLKFVKYIDEIFILSIENKHDIYIENYKILVEIRKAFLRFYTLDNNLDLSEYLD